MKALRSFRLLFPLAVAGIACSSILGIEDVHKGPKAGSGADSGEGGEDNRGGTGGNRGGTAGSGPSGGDAGSAPRGGASGAAGSSGVGGTAGDAGGGGEGDMGGGGTGGTGGTPDEGTVQGKVVNQWLQPIPNVLVTIGAADALTNDDGEFEIADVAPQYDASFTLTYMLGGTRVYGWIYQGLTRRDPTLMAEDGLTEREASLEYSANATVNNSRMIAFSLGAPSGEVYQPFDASAQIYSPNWLGPDTTTVTAHALLWSISGTLPTAYIAYDSELLALADGGDATVTFDLPDGTISAGAIGGSVTSTTNDDRYNQAHLRFTTNAAIELVNEAPTDPSVFTYTVPSIPNSTITVSASEDGPNGFGVVHQDNLTAGQSNLALQIPNPTVLVAPSPGITDVDETTQFRWNGTTDAYLWYIEDVSYFQGYRVITGVEQTTIPVVPNGLALRAGGVHVWHIQTHGNARSVDEMCGPQGYGDSYSWSSGGTAPKGPRQGDGSYTESLSRAFTMAE